MIDFQDDRDAATQIAERIEADLRVAMDGAASVSEFTVGTSLEARKPLTKEQWAVAVALNTLAELLDQRAQQACTAREPRWQGLADASTMVLNETGRLGLPQLFPDAADDDETTPDQTASA
jgi:hypothetical protein